MKVVVETPKGSFVKYAYRGGVFVRELVSPLPTLFNYGFAEGSRSSDSQPCDVLILGSRLPQGTVLELDILGYVQFIDDGVEDNKYIASVNGRITSFDRLKISVFFSMYQVFKIVYYLVGKRSIKRCHYRGIIVNNTQ